jgi:hypothetical protein
MNNVQETYTAKPVSASGAVVVGQGAIAGFLCTGAGTIQLRKGTTVAGTIIMVAMACTVGQWVPFPHADDTGVYAEVTSGTYTFFVG